MIYLSCFFAITMLLSLYVSLNKDKCEAVGGFRSVLFYAFITALFCTEFLHQILIYKK